MPRGDRTGPAGAGAMTGRGLGFCAGNNAPGFMSGGFGGGPGRGRGFGNGMGWGRGFGRGAGSRGLGRSGGYAGAYPSYGPQDEKAFLNRETELLEQELKAMKDRVKELESKEDK
ncbi:MAG: DUF5320 domain-containing protein [Candidatus Goldiibacteriota bacterium]